MKKRLVYVILSLLIPLAMACGKKEEDKEQPTTVSEVTTETVTSSQVADMYEAVGTVRSKTTSVLSSRIVGNIVAVHVREGDRVRAGQLLIEIDDRDPVAQFRKAEAGAREAEDALAEVESAIRAAESAKAAAEANRSLAASTFERFQALRERRSVSQQEFDEAEARYKGAAAEVERATQIHHSLLARKNQMLAKIEQAKAGVAGAQVYVSDTRITSPMNGIVTAKHCEVGGQASPGVPLLTVEDATHFRLEASVEENRSGMIHQGDHVALRIDALGDTELTGRVIEIAPAADPASRSTTVKIDLDWQGAGIHSPPRSGQFGRARFSLGQRPAITVPQDALVEQGQLVGVYVVDQSDTVHLRLIKTGKPYADRLEVLSGLNEGDRIVVGKVGAVSDGVTIRP